MYNQFRTLLLNLTEAENHDEHISKGYVAKALPPILRGVYQSLFPVNSSRDYKLFLAHNYLKLIEGSGLSYAITDLDPRITYNTDSDVNFQTFRKSNPVSSDPNFPLFVHGSYVVTNDVYSDKLLIQQNVSNPNEVSILSYGHARYVEGSSFSTDRSFHTVSYTSPNISDEILLPILGLRIQIAKVSGAFTDTTAKVWEVLVDAPKVFDFQEIFNKIDGSSIQHSLLAIPTKVSSKNFDNIWRQHLNPVYRLAAFVVSYVYRVNDL